MYEPANLGTHAFVNKPIRQKYSGLKDEENEMAEGMGVAFYDRDDYVQSYEGNFVWNNMHGYGEYQWQPLEHRYEGQFYVNKKEGYGRFSYPSGAYFEGLYRNDQRFGPGVYTDAAGFQDVGVWVASKLIRLSRIFEPDHIMPRLAITDEDKIRILRYRQIIHLQKDEIENVAENLLESLIHSRNYDRSVMGRAGELYNRLCRDDRAPSFNKPRYDGIFFGHGADHLTIDVLMTEEEIHQGIVEKADVPTVMVEDSPSAVNPQIKEAEPVDEVYNSSDTQTDEQYIGQLSLQNVNVGILGEMKEEEEESDYCGMKQADPESMNSTLLLGSREQQWNIFQSYAIVIAEDFPKNSDVNSASGENRRSLGETEASEEEFDDFGRKKTRDMQLTKKVVVTDLMAWNNSPPLIDLLIHVFKHRYFEKQLSFDISKILAGRRGFFRQEGAHEKAALELLEACSGGCQNTIPRLILSQNLDVDVADSRGNTGLLLAAARDRIEVIDTLLNLGADVDCMNDECLTPLSLCLLRLLALIHGVTNWSKAFLPKTTIASSMADDVPTVHKNLELWRGRVSYESLVQLLPMRMDWDPLPSKRNSEFNFNDFFVKGESMIRKDLMDTASESVLIGGIQDRAQHLVSGKCETLVFFGILSTVPAERRVTRKLDQRRPDARDEYDTDRSQAQKYIFDLSPIMGGSNSWKKLKNGKTRFGTNERSKVKAARDKKRKELFGDPKQAQDIDNSEVSTKRERMNTTISKLLCRGADPNFAQVPYPVLIMAIFTKIPTLVSELLQHGADPDATLPKSDHSLTPLLILAVLEPASENPLMAKALLKAKANPSIRADPAYCSELTERLNRNRISEFRGNSEGITPLHFLAARPDMDVDMNGHLAELIRVISRHKSIRKSDLFYGHSPLSLAIFEGNLPAVKAFLKTTCINVNEQLGADLGSMMLMLESRVLQELLPPNVLQECLELLLEHGGCPFASARVLGEEYNQIEYGRKELTKLLVPAAEDEVDINQRRRTKNKSKGSKSSKLPDVKSFAESINFIEKIAKEKLVDKMKENFVRDLMDSPIMLLSEERRPELLKEPIFKNAQIWMSAEDVATVMKKMNYNRANVRELVRLFVRACILAHGGSLSDIQILIENETQRIISEVMHSKEPKNKMTKAEDSKIDKHVGKGEAKNNGRIMVHQPESDLEDSRFDVCFECLAVRGKVLILCPKCKRVYFCSEECNLKCARQEANLHHCPVFYQKEWIRLEKIALSIGLDAISYMLRRFENPTVYVDLEKRIGQCPEPRGKRSSGNEDGNRNDTTPKCRDKNPTHYKEIGANNLDDKNRSKSEYKDDSVHTKKEKEPKAITELEGNKSDVRPDKRQKKGRTLNNENKKVGAEGIKSNKDEPNRSPDNEKDLRRNMKLREINKKGRGLDTDGDEKDNFNTVRSKKGIKKSHENENEKDDESTESSRKRKAKTKQGYGRTIHGVDETNGEIKRKLKNKKKHGIQEDGGNNIKLRNGKNVQKKDDSSLKFASNDSHWRGKSSRKKLNELHKNEDDKIKNDRQRKQEFTRNKQKEWKHELNKKRTEGKEINTLNERYKNNKHHAETNIPEKYLDWLLKVSRSAGDNLDIDMLLLPYVVFAQGDTYFRILPANQYPEFSENYSLI